MKTFKYFLLAALFLISVSAFGQIYYNNESDHYRITSDISEAYCQDLTDKMEAALQMFNELFHFDLATLAVKLKITIFNSKEDFDNYLTTFVEESRSDFTYIHYKENAAKSELVGFEKEDAAAFTGSLLHQGFIQYIKAFISEPPIWLREGAATYFEKAEWDDVTKTFTYQPNMAWLNALKSIIKGEDKKQLIPLNTLLLMTKATVSEQIDIFYPESWGLVTFLIQSGDKKYNRIFWDSIAALNADQDMAANSQLVKKQAFDWYYIATIENDFSTFILTLKTYNELIKDGIDLYLKSSLDEAYDSFTKASQLKPEEYIAFYYLGLISYNRQDYMRAEGYYNTALSLGADKSLIYYAMGINAFANNQYNKATGYLNEAKNADPDNYSEKVDAILTRMAPQS